MKPLFIFLPLLFGAVLTHPCDDTAKAACPKVLPQVYPDDLIKECWFLDIVLKCMKRMDNYCFFHFYTFYEKDCGTHFMKNYIMSDQIEFLKKKLASNHVYNLDEQMESESDHQKSNLSPCDTEDNPSV